MQYRAMVSVTGLALALAAATPANAAVSEEEAARLGGDLTPFGAEVAGNADGTIPAWTGKWRGAPPHVDYPGHPAELPSPYPDEKPLFSITPENYLQYRENLTEGQVGMFERYPTFRMDIYPSHRDFNFRQEQIDKAAWNARNTQLSNGVESVSNYTGGIAFPIPQSAEEVLWNTRTNYCHYSTTGEAAIKVVYANGEISSEASTFTQSLPFNNPAFPIPTTEKVVGDRIAMAHQVYIEPSRKKGEARAIQDPLDYKANRRNAWIYLPDIRRVRKAPAVGYDNPVPPGGLMTVDDQKGFNGAFDRYNYALIGKKEIYIPYHNYGFNDPRYGDSSLESRLHVNHTNPDYVRFEKHRVWVVEATLADGKRHAYKRRRWFIDEDSWNPVMAENFDGRDNLWRTVFLLSEYHYDIECYEKHVQLIFDLPSGHYTASFIQFEQEPLDYTVPFIDVNHFTPAYLRQSAKR